MSAPPILSYEGLSLQQGAGWLFSDIDLFIGPRDRLALIGRNGAGKTTLMKLIAGSIEPDRGKRTVVPGTNIVMLEQDPDFAPFDKLIDYCLSGERAPPEHEIRAIADQLGIDLDREAKTASGGERRRAAICRALASEPDLLLLDEPTNHLDLGAIEWLEDWLTRYKGAFMVISHDRTFLTRLTRQTLWLDRGSLRRNEIGFGGYEAWMEAVYAEEARAAERLDRGSLHREAQPEALGLGEVPQRARQSGVDVLWSHDIVAVHVVRAAKGDHPRTEVRTRRAAKVDHDDPAHEVRRREVGRTRLPLEACHARRALDGGGHGRIRRQQGHRE